VQSVPLGELAQWLVQQGVLGLVLVLVLIDYRRMYNDVVVKLKEENVTLHVLLEKNTVSQIELRATVARLVDVIEELNPRTKWRESGHA
jgi:hypothetical protein